MSIVETSTTGAETPLRHRLIAPLWHTLGLLALIAAKIANDASPGRLPPAIPLYVTGDLVLLAVLAYVWFGLWLKGESLRALTDGRWSNALAVFRDLALALGFWVVWYCVLSALKMGLTRLGISNGLAQGFVYPANAFEIALWAVSTAISGLVEETVFRGYLLRQFASLTRSTTLGCALQAILFGVAHSGFGVRQCIIIGVSGFMIGAFTLWRRSLRPAMIFHAWADFFGAVIVRGLPFA